MTQESIISMDMRKSLLIKGKQEGLMKHFVSG